MTDPLKVLLIGAAGTAFIALAYYAAPVLLSRPGSRVQPADDWRSMLNNRVFIDKTVNDFADTCLLGHVAMTKAKLGHEPTEEEQVKYRLDTAWIAEQVIMQYIDGFSDS